MPGFSVFNTPLQDGPMIPPALQAFSSSALPILDIAGTVVVGI
ncbi:hypothetical protein [Gluconobacter oxydans]